MYAEVFVNLTYYRIKFETLWVIKKHSIWMKLASIWKKKLQDA